MNRQWPEKSTTRSQQKQYTSNKSHHQQVGSPTGTGGGGHGGGTSRSRRNVEQQLKQERRDAMRARFGSDATQLKLTVYFILTVALVLLGIAFFSSNWFEVERRYYGSKFRKLGLWRMCFNSFSAPDDFQFKKFYVGCRWIFADEYRPIRRFLLPSLLTFHNSLNPTTPSCPSREGSCLSCTIHMKLNILTIFSIPSLTPII